MKYIITILVLILYSEFAFSQSISIADGTATTCSGTLFDTGGSGGGGYQNNENYTLTICPNNSNDAISLDFISFALDNSNSDNMTIYDGNSTSATTLGTYTSSQLQNTIVSASSLNSTGCLTIVFSSDAVTTGMFAATITCATPCQRPFAQAVPTPDTIAKICIGESVSFDGSTSYAQTGFNIASFYWDFDDGTIDSLSGALTSYTFNTPGVYNVQLHVVDDNGCINSNLTDLSVWVAPFPVFNPIEYDTNMCIGETVTMTAHPNLYAQTWTAVPDGNLGGPQYVPDQVGQCFTTTLDFTSFSPGQTLNNINDLLDVCINFEHSFMGDLVISLTCPTGQSVVLHQQGGGGTNLGDPNQLDGPQYPGVGWDYCWSPTATNGTWVANSTSSTVVNSSGSSSLIPGTYESLNPMSALVGCDLNGTWQIEFCDLWGADDGFVFSWGVNFNPSLFPPLTSFTPSVGMQQDSSTWSGPSISSISPDGNTITVSPTVSGTYNYTFTIISDHGCVSDTTITLTVEDPPIADAGLDTAACSGILVQLQGNVANTPAPAPACAFTLDLTDTFGDGWDGASIDVSINGNTSNYTVPLGSSSTYTFTLNDGDQLIITYNSGSFENEHIYTLTDCNGNQVFSDGPSPTTGVVYQYTHGNSVSYVYSWTPSTGLSNTNILNPIASLNGQSSYYLTIYPVGHPLCSSTDTITITVNDPSAGNDTIAIFCQTDNVVDLFSLLGGTPEFGGSWYNDSVLVSNIIDPSLIIADTFKYLIGAQGCRDSAYLIISASIPIPLSSNDTSITVDQQINLWTSGGTSYVWNPSTNLDCASCDTVTSTPGEDITYYIQITDSLGCYVVDTINVIVNYNPLFIPNGFSPNGDNNNDVFYVRGGGVAAIQIQIFDKWGNLVFESLDIDSGWDGSYKGKPLNTGVFVYRMDATLKNGENLFETGNITLFR